MLSPQGHRLSSPKPPGECSQAGPGEPRSGVSLSWNTTRRGNPRPAMRDGAFRAMNHGRRSTRGQGEFPRHFLRKAPWMRWVCPRLLHAPERFVFLPLFV